MARVRVYIKPFSDTGDYAPDWVEVTEDVPASKLSAINQQIEGGDFDVGVIRNSSLSLALMNDRSRYSDIGNAESIFRFSRADSLVKFTWDFADAEFIAGLSSVGDVVPSEYVVFTGLLNDDNAQMDLRDQQIRFTVTGRETAFDHTIVPVFTPGQLFSQLILAALNQADITAHLTVSAPNFSLGLDFAPDNVTVYVNKTVKEFLADALLLTNSVLYIEGDAIKIVGRIPTADVRFNFYGQASQSGRDNIIDILAIKNGTHRLFNFITWEDTSLAAQDSNSLARYGYRKKAIQSEAVTDATKRQNALNAIRDEFGSVKQEFLLATPFTYEALALRMLDRVSIDYPVATITSGLDPLYEVAEYGVAEYPKTLSDFQILPNDHYKIIGRKVDLIKQSIQFKMRQI